MRRLDSTIKLQNCQCHSSLLPMNIRISFSSPTHSPLSHASEHSRKKNRLMYKQVDKWYSAPHCLILTYICSSEDSYLRKGIEKLSCTHKSQTNSHFTSDKAVKLLKLHFIQWDRPLLALQHIQRVPAKMRIWMFLPFALGQRHQGPTHRGQSWWEGCVWGHRRMSVCLSRYHLSCSPTVIGKRI